MALPKQRRGRPTAARARINAVQPTNRQAQPPKPVVGGSIGMTGRALTKWFAEHPNRAGKAAQAYLRSKKPRSGGAKPNVADAGVQPTYDFTNAPTTAQLAAFTSGVSAQTGAFISERTQSRLASGEAETNTTRGKGKKGKGGKKGDNKGGKKPTGRPGQPKNKQGRPADQGFHINAQGKVVKNRGGRQAPRTGRKK